jgi:hypothetical protein
MRHWWKDWLYPLESIGQTRLSYAVLGNKRVTYFFHFASAVNEPTQFFHDFVILSLNRNLLKYTGHRFGDATFLSCGKKRYVAATRDYSTLQD